MTDQDKVSRPAITGDDIVVPSPGEPEGSVGSEGGTSLIGNPRYLENNADTERIERERLERSRTDD